MSYISRQKVGKNIYLIECTGYRNDEKKSRNKRRYVGKVDPVTGKEIYKDWYIEECKGKNITIVNPTNIPEFSIDDILKSNVRSYGLFYFMKQIAERIKLTDALQNSFMDEWREYFMLSVYIIGTNDPLMCCKDWIQDTESYEVRHGLSSQYISKLLTSKSPDARNNFFSQWYIEHGCDECFAIDITSESSYSELIDSVESGFNRDHEPLQQINNLVLIGEKERLPILQSLFSGSIGDVRMLKVMIEESKLSLKTLLFDKGFYSKDNIDALIEADMNFLVAMPFTSKLSCSIVDMAREEIENPNNAITINGTTVVGVCKKIQWDENHVLYAEIFFNPVKAANAKAELYTKCAELKKIIMENPKPYYDTLWNESIREEIKKCKDSEKKKDLENQFRYVDPKETRLNISEVRGLFKIEENKVTIDQKITSDTLRTSGWLIILSSRDKEPSDVLSSYRVKDVLEKAFWRNKNSTELNRLQVHGNEATHARMFIGFLASILMCYMDNVMTAKNLYKKYTMYELVKKLYGLRVMEIKGKKILYPGTNDQREIFDAFEIEYPDRNGVIIET